MALNMENTQGHGSNQIRQLRLVYLNGAAEPLGRSSTHPACSQIQHRLATQITNALMCRLWIPRSSTIVGLLGVGPSKSNYEELLKWVKRELPLTETRHPQEVVTVLSRKFLRIADDWLDGFTDSDFQP